MNQFGGEHRFDRLKDFSINWLYTDATANRDEPKTRDYRYDISQQTDQYIFSQRVDSNVITYADLVDKDRSWRVDGKLPWQITPFHKVTFSGGMITQEKTVRQVHSALVIIDLDEMHRMHRFIHNRPWKVFCSHSTLVPMAINCGMLLGKAINTTPRKTC